MKKKQFKAALAWCFYKVKFDEPYKWGKEEFKWRFKMYPRKINMVLLTILIIPLTVLLVGIMGIAPTVKDLFKIQSWSSYEFYLPAGQKPSKWHAYLKF